MATINDFKVNDKVLFGRSHGEQTLGTVVKVNPSRLKVRQEESRGSMRSHPVGTLWTVPPSLCRLANGTTATTAPSKRAEADILKDIAGVYSGLSPENLWMDGEATQAAAARKAVGLKARLRSLFVELGREVTESEAYGATPVSRATTNAAGFKPGDKVSFKDNGKLIEGVVHRANIRTVTVHPIVPPGMFVGRYWRIPPSMLTKVA